MISVDMASSWETIKIFVTSYGKEFTKERDVVLKEVINVYN